MEKNARFAETVKGESRTYFFDLKISERGDPYLLITESRKSKEMEGEFDRSRILIWDRDLAQFAEALNKAVQHRQQAAEATKS